jgi:hypothetical protein
MFFEPTPKLPSLSLAVGPKGSHKTVQFQQEITTATVVLWSRLSDDVASFYLAKSVNEAIGTVACTDISSRQGRTSC